MSSAERQLQRIFESDVVGILEVSGDFRFIRANKGFLDLLGYTMEELRDKSNLDLTHPHDREASRQVYQQLLEGADLVRYEKRYVAKDGRAIQCYVGVQSGDRDISGRPTWFLGFISPMTEIVAARSEAQTLSNKLDQVYRETAGALARAIEARDSYTAGHQDSVATLAVGIAREMGVEAQRLYGIYLAGVVHDIGKIGVPPEFLSKVTKLSSLELDFIRQHSAFGHEILKGVKSPWPLAEVSYQHHERMDGTGYPNKLMGTDILLESRIIAVADTVDSMVKPRPYRVARGAAETEKVLLTGRGHTLDADVVDACLRLDVLSKPLETLQSH